MYRAAVRVVSRAGKLLSIPGCLLFAAGTVSVDGRGPDNLPVIQQIELVAPGVISLPDRNETFPAVDPRDGSLWFSVYEDDFDAQTLMFARWGAQGWGDPETASFSGKWGDRAARFDPDGSILYFTSNRPLPGESGEGDMNLWRVQRDESGLWKDPEPVPGPINSDGRDIHGLATQTGLWIASRREGGLGRSDIYRVARETGEITHLGPPVNDEFSQPDLWVSPDESWMVFVITDHPGGLGGDDLYVSVRRGGEWSEPRNVGRPINSAEYEYGPALSADGNHLLFTSHRRGSADIYRVPVSVVRPRYDAPSRHH